MNLKNNHEFKKKCEFENDQLAKKWTNFEIANYVWNPKQIFEKCDQIFKSMKILLKLRTIF